MVLGAVALAFGVPALGAGRASSTLPVPLTGVRPLQTAVTDSVTFILPEKDSAFAHTRTAGASFVRIDMGWQYILRPAALKTKPKGFDPADPNDPNYDWGSVDAQVRDAVRHGLEPIVTVFGAPSWAIEPAPGLHGLGRPDPAAVAQFALAGARRFSGADPAHPRVRYWEAWNEPNHVGAAALKKGAADWYRTLVNDLGAAVDGVHRDNIVIAGSSSPFGTASSVAPMTFMRQLLCVGGGARPHATCSKTIHFDIWGHHPYTSGGPTHHAAGVNDASLGDLPEMGRLLDAAIRAHHVISSRKILFWVTEFGWDTNPPDPKGVPIALQTRWTAEALYRMWATGVSLVAWFRVRDDPVQSTFYQSGLYYRGSDIRRDRPKPTFYAFRFPFVAFRQGDRVFVWGRTPASDARRVVVEQLVGSRWRAIGTLRSDRYGIFSRIYSTSDDGSLRARLAGSADASVPFSLHVPPDHFYPIFGS